MKKINFNKPKSNTSLFSVRIDSKVLDDFRSRGINVSSAFNMFLKKYLSTQKYDDSSVLCWVDSIVFDDFVIDVYKRRKILY